MKVYACAVKLDLMLHSSAVYEIIQTFDKISICIYLLTDIYPLDNA